MEEEKFSLDKLLSIDINMILRKGEEYYPRKLHITLDLKLLNQPSDDFDYEDTFKNCKSFVGQGIYMGMEKGLCDVKDLNESDIVDHLLEVIDDLAYSVACYKYPDHYEHKYDKEEILTDAGLNKEIRKRLLD